MKRRNLRRIIVLMLCMILVIGCGSFSAFAQPEKTFSETLPEENVPDTTVSEPEDFSFSNDNCHKGPEE